MAWAAIAAALALAAASTCERGFDGGSEGPLTFEVDITEGDAGTAQSPIPFSSEPIELGLDIRAVDRDGELADWFEGTVHLDVAPRGRLARGEGRPPEEVTLSGGVAEGVPVHVERLHGDCSIWVEDVGTEEEPGSWATGLSPTIRVADPTIRNVQETDLYLSSALKGDFLEVNLEGRIAVVTGVFPDGFYVTDTSEEGYLWSAAYAYTHSRPDVELGDRIAALSGTADEFYGFTELGFPSWRTEGTADLPEPVLLTADLVDDNGAMEMYESGLVELRDVVVCPIGEAYATYGQWKVLVDPEGSCGGGGSIDVVSAYTVPGFDPAGRVGESIELVRGNLRYHSSADPGWIVYARFDGDIVVGGE